MRLTGNAAKAMLAIAVASAGWLPPDYRRAMERQYQIITNRENRRLRRLASDPEVAAQRIVAAAERRQRRAKKRYADHQKCLANNPCHRGG